jgi:hypothetical protein
VPGVLEEPAASFFSDLLKLIIFAKIRDVVYQKTSIYAPKRMFGLFEHKENRVPLTTR